MNHVSAGVIDDAHLVEEAAAPDAKRTDAVGEGEPEGHKDHPGREIHAAEVRSGGDDKRDGREGELEIDHCRLREVLRQRRGWKDGLLELIAHVDGDARVAYEWKHLIPERHLISPNDPAQKNHGKGVEGHKGRIDGPFVLHPAGVQNHKPRNTLEGDQAASRQLPRVVALDQPVRVHGRSCCGDRCHVHVQERTKRRGE